MALGGNSGSGWRKWLALGVASLVFGLLLISGPNADIVLNVIDYRYGSSNNTITVCASGCNYNYSAIQGAIDSASNGDTVYVYNGTIDIPACNSLIIRTSINFTGQDKNGVILNGHTSIWAPNCLSCIWVYANNVDISGFTIQHCDSGITISDSSSNIYDNIISNNTYGITINSSTNNSKITNNILNYNQYGINYYYWNESYTNTIVNNTILYNVVYDININIFNIQSLIINNQLCTINCQINYMNFNCSINGGNITSGSNWIYLSDNSCTATDIYPPNVTLNSPSNYSADIDGNVTFTFVPRDQLYASSGLAYCSLWGNFTGTWQLNQTKTNVTNGTSNSFVLNNLNTGSYLWNVNCSDNNNNSAFAPANYTILVEKFRINEFLPHPRGNNPEWIELYNLDNLTLDLGGFKLSDNGGSPTYTIPNGTTITGNGFKVFYSTNTSINLGDMGDSVKLYDAYNNLIDSYTYSSTQYGFSIGRGSDGIDDWTTFEVPTPGVSNQIASQSQNPPTVILNTHTNNDTSTNGVMFFTYTPSTYNTVSYCILYTNITGSWGMTQMDTTISANSLNSFALFNLQNGAYLWNVQCTNSYGSAFADSNRIFNVNIATSNIYSTQVNSTGIVNLTSNATSTDLLIQTSENTTGTYISVSSYSSNPTNATLQVYGLNKFISIDTSSELSDVLSWALLKVYYTDDEISARGLNESQLEFYWYNSTLSEWQKLNMSMSWVYGTGVDTNNNYVWANVSHFSEYTLAQETPPSVYNILLQQGWNLISLPLNV